MRRQVLKAPATKDVCIFCLARTQFSSVHALRRPTERRPLSSTRSLNRPPANAVAQEQRDDVQDADPAWTAPRPPRTFSGRWARRGASSDLTPAEKAMVKNLQELSMPEPEKDEDQLLRRHDVESPRSYLEVAEKEIRMSKPTLSTRVSDAENDKRRLHIKKSKVLPRPSNVENTQRRPHHFPTIRPPVRMSQQTSRLVPPEARITRPEDESEEKKSDPLQIEGTSSIAVSSARSTSPPARATHHRPKFGSWAKTETTAELTPEEKALRQTLQKAAAPEAQLSANQINHSRRTFLLRHSSLKVKGPSESDLRTEDAHAEESAHSSAAQMSSDELERLYKNKNRRARNAKLDQLISQSPSQAEAQKGDWYCPSCERHNSPSRNKCRICQTERMEKTKNDGFVGLRGQYDTAIYRAMSDSYWSSQVSSPQVPDAEPTASNTPNNSTTEGSTSESGLVHWRTADEQSITELESSFKERGRPTRPKSQEGGIARQLVLEESLPLARRSNREQLRKSKKRLVNYDEEDEEDEDRAARRLERIEQRKKAKAAKKAVDSPTPIYLPEFITVANLAGVLRVRVEDFIHKMEDLGFDEIQNDHILDAETAGLVAAEFNFEPMIEQVENADILPRPPAKDKSVLPPRPPVVTIMGHVDHGKTTLLDYLQKSSVAASEPGGITQHIGAFSVPMPGGRLVTFLDTPGHEAFLSMRQRGANVTDIVILVVAADDSVKPQTVEAIRHAQAAKVPMIVAINKIDKEDSNVERVKQDLARYGVEIEDFGGDTQVVCVSGKTGQGMEELEDAAVALADILDMRSETDGQAEGWVLEATTKKAGRVATVLVRRGTVRPGDIIVAGTSWARVRSVRNEAGVMLASAGPGTPVEIDGWREQPAAGDEVLQAPDEQRAKAVIEYRLESNKRVQMASDMTAVNEARRLEQEKREESERAAQDAESSPNDSAATTSVEGQTTLSTPSLQEVFFIVKADVSGSVEAVTNAISALGNSEVRPNILRAGVGPVTEFDIDHAAVAKGHIITFNTTISGNLRRTAETKKVDILDQSIIYRLVDDVKAKLSEQLPDLVTQKVLGEAEIAQVFDINIKGRVTVPVAGCKIRNGVIARVNKVRVLRGKEVIYDGSLSSLKNVKKDVTEMRKGTECGMGFEGWTAFRVGDQVQTYEEVSEKRAL